MKWPEAQRLIEDFEEAVHDKAWIGTKDERDHAIVLGVYRETKQRLLGALVESK